MTVSRSNITDASDPATVRAPPEKFPAQDWMFSGVRLSDEVSLDASIVVPKVSLSLLATVVARSGRPVTKADAWSKNSFPNTRPSRSPTSTAPPPTRRAASPRDRPRAISLRIPGSSATANSQASSSRKRKWRVTENSHSASSKAATRDMMMTPARRTDPGSNLMPVSASGPGGAAIVCARSGARASGWSAAGMDMGFSSSGRLVGLGRRHGDAAQSPAPWPGAPRWPASYPSVNRTGCSTIATGCRAGAVVSTPA